MSKRELFIIWGENPDHGAEPTGYEFDTEAEQNAFLRGAEEAIGWGDFATVPNADYKYDSELGDPVPSADFRDI